LPSPRQELVKSFEKSQSLPIEPEDVRLRIMGARAVGQITFYRDPHMPAGVVRGVLDHYDCKYLDPNHAADIYFPDGMGPEWERLVWTKEMFNIFDNGDDATASDDAKVAKLVGEMITPPALYKDATLFDKAALVWALLTLFPKPIRDAFLPLHKEGKITDEQLATIAELPVRYIRWAMSDGYSKAHAAWMAA
jgi:hypothetical protein